MYCALALFVCGLGLGLACSSEFSGIGSSNEPRALWVLNSARLGIGEIAVVERVVVTPPQLWPRPVVAPDSLTGLTLLDVSEAPTEEYAARWVHRSQVRIRADAIGAFEWPASRVEIAGSGGVADTLALAAFSIDVKSILSEFPERSAPFGLRRPDSLGSPGPNQSRWLQAMLLVAVVGAALALLGIGAKAAQRFRARRKSRPPLSLPWQTAHAAIARAAALGASDPLAAAHELSPALRRYMAARYGADTRGRTCEELSSAEPAFAMRSSWPPFSRLVGELDGLRFQPAERVGDVAAARLDAWLAAAAQCVDKTIPPEHRE